jgi:23S rRNA (uracil1939-C5)-methyltransferase
VLHDSVGKRITALSELIASLKQYEQIPQIEIAVGDDNKTALIIRHLVALSAEDREKCREFAKLHSFELYLQPSSPDPLEKIWPEDEVHLLSYRLPEFNIEIQFHPLSFTQVNREMNPLMIKQAIQWLNPIPSETLLDLYCGLGNFTLPLTRYAKYVTGIEGSDLMVQNAQKNATHNNIDNVDFYAADLTKPSRDAEWMQKTYASILLDPPRTGAKEMLPFFPIFSANKILYVSCNPATLSRDAGELVHIYGYTLKQVGIINMFPHTTHIEAMALFEK